MILSTKYLFKNTCKITCLLFSFFILHSFNGIAGEIHYNICDFGAVGDGQALCTDAFNKAIDKCNADGGGTVIVPRGIFKSGTIVLKTNVNLHLEMGATISASTNHADFPRQKQPEYRSQKDPGGWYALIYAEGASNIAVTGFGTIEGNGKEQTPAPDHTLDGDRDGRVRNLLFISCNQVRIEGIKMRNSGIWNQHFLNCEDVIVDRINVYNHANENNDAIDIDGCRRFVLSNSILDSEDDCIVLKSTGIAPAEDIVITNCITSSYCNAIKLGTESTGGYRNISISNCVVRPSRSSASVYKTNPKIGICGIALGVTDGGVMEGITISNITISGTECPFFIRLANRARKHVENAPEPPIGHIRNISISNITAFDCGNTTSSITAIPGCAIENININNVQIYNSGGLKSGGYIVDYKDVTEDEKGYPEGTGWGNLPASTFFIRHVKNLAINNLMFGSDQPDPRIPIIAIDVENMQINKTIYAGDENKNTLIVLDQVRDFSIEKPQGWDNDKYIKQID
ncbi:glycosyl hydrolase family 28 protein [Draconibacterium sp. IB214405]|uniref:glycoside hydrolase family 28 protein n=1 Tax=Draconibacterium sp. IB214405 TaxID=3097352 RepID=UPI002A134C26|nr:glycosyl hydrolase family 28 protein [Draconibacterium sp. IB214405]MDX8339632.1 glycosyl hydrolase family 28 protein [Draconibacterium sp. IB214405]